jgi:hypothetical protein
VTYFVAVICCYLAKGCRHLSGLLLPKGITLIAIVLFMTRGYNKIKLLTSGKHRADDDCAAIKPVIIKRKTERPGSPIRGGRQCVIQQQCRKTALITSRQAKVKGMGCNVGKSDSQRSLIRSA